jgi:hypothetical protein
MTCEPWQEKLDAYVDGDAPTKTQRAWMPICEPVLPVPRTRWAACALSA